MQDLKAAYLDTEGSISDIMAHIPHSVYEDEPRFVMLLSKLVSEGDLPKLSHWEASLRDEKAQMGRQKQGKKEAAEAEELARSLGVWDEFYGSGKQGKRKGKGKGKAKDPPVDDDGEDVSALQALILKKKEKSQDSFLDGLAAKYTAGGGSKSRKRKEPEIDDAEFERLQGELFNPAPEPKKGRAKRAKA